MASFATFIGNTNLVTLAPGDVLFHENEPADGCMYALIEGAISIVRGGCALERIDREGGIFGELALLDDLPRSASAIALAHSKVARIGEERFRELTLRNPSFALEMMKLLARRIRANLPPK